jgi:hypothetical protein
MELIESHLNEAITFLNGHLRESKSHNERDKWCNILTDDILKLDNMTNSRKRKEIIMAIQNVLYQLDHIFEKGKSPILLLNVGKRESYLPENKDSHYALGNSFQTHLIVEI